VIASDARKGIGARLVRSILIDTCEQRCARVRVDDALAWQHGAVGAAQAAVAEEVPNRVSTFVDSLGRAEIHAVAEVRRRIRSIGAEDDVLLVRFGCDDETAARRRAAEDDRTALRVGAFLRRPARVQAHLHTLEVVAQNDVDDAADRVGTIDGRGAVRQNFDPLDGLERDHVQVDTLIRRDGRARQAPTIQ
jgi:hypothetical protein